MYIYVGKINGINTFFNKYNKDHHASANWRNGRNTRAMPGEINCVPIEIVCAQWCKNAAMRRAWSSGLIQNAICNARKHFNRCTFLGIWTTTRSTHVEDPACGRCPIKFRAYLWRHISRALAEKKPRDAIDKMSTRARAICGVWFGAQ